MADNVPITPGVGASIAADEIAGVKYQRVKIVPGADGADDGDVSSANPLPVVQTGTPALPTGAASSAKQDTGNTSLTSIDGKITAVDTGAVVVASSALPSGAATAAKQPALGTAGTASADVITVQGKAAMTPVLTDGSATTQPVSAASLPLPSGAATAAKQDTGNTSLGTIDTSTAASAAGTGATTDAAATAGSTGSLSAKQRLMTSQLDSIKTALEIIDNMVSGAGANITQIGGSNVVTGSGTAAGSLRVELPTNGTGVVGLSAGTNAIGKLSANSGVDIGDVDVTSSALPTGASTAAKQPALGTAGSPSTDVITIQGIASGTVVPISVATIPSHAVTNAGTFATQATVQGDVAHDGVNSGNPNQLGAEAIAHGTNPTAVAAADRTKLYANRAGIPFVIGGHPNIVTFEAAYIAAQTDTAIVTVAAGLKIVVTQVQATTDAANTVATAVRVGFGATNTPTTTGVVLTHPGIVPGGGITRGDGNGILGVGADGEDLRITSTVPTTGSLRVLVSYHTIES